MGATDIRDRDQAGESTASSALAIAPETVEIRRHRLLFVGLAVVASVVGVTYLTRASATGALVDWAVTLVLLGLSLWHGYLALDARTPLLIADAHGVRVRKGRSQWQGLTWESIAHLEHRPARLFFLDGRLTLEPTSADEDLVVVPLGLATRSSHRGSELTGALRSLAGPIRGVVEAMPGLQPKVRIAEAIDELGERLAHRDDVDDEPAEGMLAPMAEQVEPMADRVKTIAQPIEPIEPIAEPIEPMAEVDDRLEPASNPVIGPELAAARHRLGLSVDQLADRTRIRPHVIEAIEVDDFEPCGGDFYARGHLRTLSRILGIESAPLMALYGDRYENAPIDPRRVFAADVTGGSMRGTRGGPNWSVSVAAVMALVLVWSIARLLMDAPAQVEAVPGINGSGGITTVGSATAESVPVLVRAAGGGATVTVRDGSGKIVFTGDIAFGQTRSVKVSPPVKIQSSDGSVEVVVNGTERGRIGKIGEAAENTYIVR